MRVTMDEFCGAGSGGSDDLAWDRLRIAWMEDRRHSPLSDVERNIQQSNLARDEVKIGTRENLSNGGQATASATPGKI